MENGRKEKKLLLRKHGEKNVLGPKEKILEKFSKRIPNLGSTRESSSEIVTQCPLKFFCPVAAQKYRAAKEKKSLLPGLVTSLTKNLASWRVTTILVIMTVQNSTNNTTQRIMMITPRISPKVDSEILNLKEKVGEKLESRKYKKKPKKNS